MNSKWKGLLQLIRPINVGMVLLTIVGAAVLAGGEFHQWWRIIWAALSAGSIAAGGYAINDYFDVKIDAVNRPERPLPAGLVSATEAWWVWRLCSSAGVILSAFLGPEALGIALFWVFSLYFYSKHFKRTVLWGNLLVGIATGLAFVYGGVAVGQIERSYWPALFAFLINLAREVVKDVEDREGDAQGSARTLPVVYGIKPALTLATLTLIVLVGATIAAYHFGIYNQRYLVVVALVDSALLGVAVLLWQKTTPMHLHRMSTVLKLAMVGGLLAMFFGST
jgi:geranylgeranylglycerol-phosphate geranylgeranyltransferase